MTGMEHTIEQVAQVAASAMDGYSEGASHIDDYRIIARALAEAGLIAPAPLTEERSIVIPNGRGFEFSHLTDFEQFAKENGGEERTRWVTAWEPVYRAEGDGRADCGCAHCHTGPFPIMHVCADCGSKRCPRAIHHANPCDGRAEP